MKGNFEKALAAVLDHEGGYVNHPRDPGGMTNLGVTKVAWEEWVGHSVDEKEMRALTPEKVAPMYKRRYWDKVCGDELPEGLDYIVFDTAVNSGPGRAVKLLQGCLDVTQDGALGPKTLQAVRETGPQKLIAAYAKARLDFLAALPTWDAFGKGWSRRVAEVFTSAEKMTA